MPYTHSRCKFIYLIAWSLAETLVSGHDFALWLHIVNWDQTTKSYSLVYYHKKCDKYYYTLEFGYYNWLNNLKTYVWHLSLSHFINTPAGCLNLLFSVYKKNYVWFDSRTSSLPWYEDEFNKNIINSTEH